MRMETVPFLSATWDVFGEDIKLQLQESFFKGQIQLYDFTVKMILRCIMLALDLGGFSCC